MSEPAKILHCISAPFWKIASLLSKPRDTRSICGFRISWSFHDAYMEWVIFNLSLKWQVSLGHICSASFAFNCLDDLWRKVTGIMQSGLKYFVGVPLIRPPCFWSWSLFTPTQSACPRAPGTCGPITEFWCVPFLPACSSHQNKARGAIWPLVAPEGSPGQVLAYVTSVGLLLTSGGMEMTRNSLTFIPWREGAHFPPLESGLAWDCFDW